MKDDLGIHLPIASRLSVPADWALDPTLKAVGKRTTNIARSLMDRNKEGLTKTYNRFHDPYDRDPGVGRLRELHTEMDRAVLAACGWDDIPTDCEFLLDYEIDEEEWGNKTEAVSLPLA